MRAELPFARTAAERNKFIRRIAASENRGKFIGAEQHAEQESSGNILNDIAIRSMRDVFRGTINGAIADGSLQTLLAEIGYA